MFSVFTVNIFIRADSIRLDEFILNDYNYTYIFKCIKISNE